MSNKNESRARQEDNLFEVIFIVKRLETMQWGEISHHKICKCLNDWGEKGLFFYKDGQTKKEWGRGKWEEVGPVME